MEDLSWKKSAKSDNGGNCVEIGTRLDGRAAAIRDSKSPDGYLSVTPAVLSELLTSVKNGELDRLDEL
jgi:Domain of unknown function (DUF397)